VASIPGKEVISTGTGKKYLDAGLARPVAEKHGVDRRGISQRFVEDIEDPGKFVDHLRSHPDSVEWHAKVLRHALGEFAINTHALRVCGVTLKTYRKTAECLRRDRVTRERDHRT
jgi:hypothetical protein